ncbi:MAG: hypothetical protein MI922_12050, partial [Bacteroidales bacterium]|nr:hypothetical protein [Bacteroidales bacterium]
MNRILYLVIIICFSGVSLAQQTVYHTHENNDYWRAMELFEKEKYSMAQKYFELTYQKEKKNDSYLKTMSQYHMALCAIKQFNEDAEYLTFKFVSENPESPLINEAYFHLGNYFYVQKKWNDG